jgi:hypothetical protein
MSQSSKLIDFSKNDYYKTATIPPPEDDLFYDGESRITRVVVDSKDRDVEFYPSPNKYSITFDDEITDIISAQLINIYVPTPMYLVNNSYNKFTCVVNSISYIITLTIADYSPTDLAMEISNQLANQSITCVYNQNKDNYNFYADLLFTFDFTSTSSVARLLGFQNKIYGAIPDNSVFMMSSEFRKDFEYNNYVIMYIDQFDVNKNGSSVLNKSFAIIPNKNESANLSDDLMITKYFSPPLGRLDKLRISFFDRFGKLYDFQNMDHRFELLFKSHKQRRKYGPIMKNHY